MDDELIPFSPAADVSAQDERLDDGRARRTVEVVGETIAVDLAVLTPEALELIGELERSFGPRIDFLLAERSRRQEAVDAGAELDFLPETADVREGDWKVAPIPPALQDRRVEITGPVSAKMVIGALNSGAQCFMADFEDATTPTWRNLLEGQVNLRLAVRGELTHVDEAKGKTYSLGEETATLLVRPRGLHLPERGVIVDGRLAHGALFDAAVFLAANAKTLIENGAGPYLYLPKLEHHLEARLWDEILGAIEFRLGLPEATIKTTVLIETLPAVFQMDEILWELRKRCVGLNCGRWDYIFSYIKTFASRTDRVLPDRGTVGMDRPFLAAYAKLLIQTCHQRGAFAMGGMAAQIPNRHDPEANAAALAKVRADKKREAEAGHDGTWVAHPGLIAIAREEMDAILSGPNQLDRPIEGDAPSAEDLVEAPVGTRTIEGLRANLDVALRYVESWLRGQGCVAIHGLMEDAATAEISRAQVWQWRRHGAVLEDGRRVTDALVREEMARALDAVDASPTSDSRFDEAAALLEDLVLGQTFTTFLTLPAYDRV